MIHVSPVLDGDDRLLHSLGYLVRLEDNRAPTVRVPSRCRPRHHHLRSGDEDAEVLALQVPNRCKLGRTAVRWRGHPTQEHSTNTEDSLQQSVARRGSRHDRDKAVCGSRLLQGVTACDVSGAGLGSHAGQSVVGLSAEAMRWMSSTASLTCVDGWTPPIRPAPVSRPALLTASRSTSAAPGRCATYALSAATAPRSSLIFSARSASSSIGLS